MDTMGKNTSSVADNQHSATVIREDEKREKLGSIPVADPHIQSTLVRLSLLRLKLRSTSYLGYTPDLGMDLLTWEACPLWVKAGFARGSSRVDG